jgi:hypothetical protein
MGSTSGAARPRPVSDRPLAVLDIVDGSFAALRQRPRTLIAVVLPVLVPLEVLQAYLSRHVLGGVGLADVWADPTVAGEQASAGSSVVPMLTDLILGSLAVSVSGVAVAHVVTGWLEGRDPSAAQALGAVARRWWVVLSAWLVVRVLQALAAVVFVVPALFVVALLSVTSPVVAVEGRGPWASVRRSASLVRPRLGPVLGVVLLAGVVSYGVSQAIEALPATIALILGPDRAWPLLAASGILSSLVVVPFVAASATLTYLDLRFRTEGLDLERDASEVLPGVG